MSTAEGALVSSGANEMQVFKTVFSRCSSKTQCGGLKKTGGILVMRCCCLNECYGQTPANTQGNAMGTKDCDAACSDIAMYLCWKQTSPHTENIYGFEGRTADVVNVNCSHSVSSGGALSGSYYSVNPGASIRFVQGVNGKEFDAFEAWETDQTVTYMNIVNNSFSSCVFFTSSARVTVFHGCIFNNDKCTDMGSVVAYDCVSDTHPRATTSAPYSTVRLVAEDCWSSMKFTRLFGCGLSTLHFIWIIAI